MHTVAAPPAGANIAILAVGRGLEIAPLGGDQSCTWGDRLRCRSSALNRVMITQGPLLVVFFAQYLFLMMATLKHLRRELYQRYYSPILRLQVLYWGQL